MMLVDEEHLKQGEQLLLERRPPSAAAAPAGGAENDRPRADAEEDSAHARGPAPQQPPSGEGGVLEFPPEREDQRLEQDRHPEDHPRGSFLQRRAFVLAIGAVLLLPAVAGGYLYLNYASHFESTDDAFIATRQFAIAPQVSGNVTAVPVTDNQHVAAGDLIAQIDDRSYRAAVEQAQAQVAAGRASIQNIDAQIAVQQAQIGQSQAQVEQAQAGLTFAQQQAVRYEDLAKRGAGTIQNAEQYVSQLRQQQAALKSAQASLNVAQRQIKSLEAQRSSAVANLAQAQAQLDQAQLNLSYTNVTAAEPGQVVNLSAGVGQFAQAGTSLTMFVPDKIWVTANFKETQLDHMRPGQAVTISIDAYPERVLRGHIASVQPGSGTAFSVLPAENATGNYVKVVQRVPVKIIIDNPPTDVALGPGMSVEPTVRVNPAPSLLEELRADL